MKVQNIIKYVFTILGAGMLLGTFFFTKATSTNNKQNPARKPANSCPEWGCIPDTQIWKFKGGKQSGGRTTKQILTVRIYR